MTWLPYPHPARDALGRPAGAALPTRSEIPVGVGKVPRFHAQSDAAVGRVLPRGKQTNFGSSRTG